MDDTFDVAEYDDLKILVDIYPTTQNTECNIQAQINGITSGYPYTMCVIDGDNTVSTGETTLNSLYLSFKTYHASVAGKSVTDITLNRVKNKFRYSQTQGSYFTTGGANQKIGFYSYLLPIVDTVNTFRIFSTPNTNGNVRVYAPVKTHLISNNPGLLKGMWQKSIDADTIEVQPGQIEIGATVCHQTKPVQVSLSGSLRTGEIEQNDTLYFLYAVRGSGRSLSYKFSSTAPLMDRYGNQVASFEDCDVDQDWYHPIEGHTWRYIGQVNNLASGDIAAFDKCKPGYFESPWVYATAMHTVTIPIAVMSKKYKETILGSSDLIKIHTVPAQDKLNNGEARGYHIYERKLNEIDVSFQTYMFNNGVSWRTTGYVKVTLTIQ